MKQKLLNSFKLKATLLVAVLCALFTGTAWGAEEVYKTALFGSDYNANNSSYTSSFDATNGSFIVTATNFNNNNNGWTNSAGNGQIKCGRKNNASVGTITTKSAIDEAITKVVVTVDAFTSGKVNSFKLYVASDASFTQNLQTITATIATGANTFTVTTPTANRYYKVEIDCASGSGNGLVTVSKVEYYYNAGGNPLCATPTFNPAEGTYTSAQNITISTTTNGATIYYTTDGNDPTTNSNVYSSAIPVSSTTTIKAMAAMTGMDNSAVASATYTIVNLAHAGTEQDPYTVADARTAIDASTGVSNVYATGIISQVDSYNSNYNSITYWISEDGTTTSDQLEVYSGKGLNNTNFTSVNDVVVGATVVVYGNLTKYNNTTYEFSSGNYLTSYTAPTTPTITTSTPSLSGFTYETGNGPSDEKTFTVSGVSLTAGIALSLGESSNFEISTTSGSSFGSSVNLASNASDVTVYVRLKSDLAAGDYNGTVTLTSSGATDVTVSLSGSVTVPEAAHVTWNLSTNSYDSNPTTNLVTWSSSYATMTNAKGSGTAANNYLGGDSNNRTSSRFYSGNTLTITPASGYAITSVVFEATSNGYASALTNSSWTNATAAMEEGNDVTTVTVTPTNGALAISATIGGTCGFTSVKVYYVEDNTTYYNINLDDQVEHGTISANLNKAEEGATVTLTASPETNYELSGWTVLDGNADEVIVTVSQENENVATFTMPSSDVEVSATFATTLTSYNITVDSDIENGTVEADMATAFEGATVTLTVTPATGFGLKTILVMTDGSVDVEVTKSNNTTYTFEMPADNVNVMAEFEAVTNVTYTLASSITSGKHYVIASGNDGTVKVMGTQNTNNRAAVDGTVSNNTLSVTSNAGAVEFVIYGPDADNHYTIYDADEGGYLYAVGGTSNNHLKTESTPAAHGHWTISLENNDDANGASLVANITGRNTMRYNSGSTIFSCYASASQSPIYLYEKSGEATPTESKTLNAYGFATYASQNALDFTSNSDVTAWVITDANSTTGKITFSQITGKAPAGTGLFLCGEANVSVSISSATGTVTPPSSNLLEGITTATEVTTTGQYYGLKGNEFVPVNAGTVPAGKALLPASEVSSGSGVKAFTFVFEDATGIKTVEHVSAEQAAEIFNLAGQRLSKMQRGVNIVNGKKVLVR